MKVLALCYFPVNLAEDQGGAQHVFMNICRLLIERKVEITVLCPSGIGIRDRIVQGNLTILPAGNWWRDRALPPWERGRYWHELADYSNSCDVVWSVDRAIPFRLPRPTVLSLSNFSYPPEMDSLWKLSWDALAVPSRYLFDIASTIAGESNWLDSPPPQIHLVPNGIDLSAFRRVDGSDLSKRLALVRKKKYIIFPHRPDHRKGFEHMISILARLVLLDPAYHLLIPVSLTYPSDRVFYDGLARLARRLRLEGHVTFHPWVQRQDLPQYFSCAHRCVSLSTLPEGFGLTPVQSIACGTPVVCRRTGALKDLLPDRHGVNYVDFHDDPFHLEQFTAVPSKLDVQRGTRYVRKHYSQEEMAERFLQLLSTVRKTTGNFTPSRASKLMRLAPWCRRVAPNLVWHDYRGRYFTLRPSEQALLDSLEHAGKHPGNRPEATALALVRRGFLVHGSDNSGNHDRFAGGITQ